LAHGAALAHELRPAFLNIRETGEDLYAVSWKVPAQSNRRLALYAKLPASCEIAGEKVRSFQDAAYFELWTAKCPGGLKGQVIAIEGLRASLTDALVRIAYLGGTSRSFRLTPDQPELTATGDQTAWEVSATYLSLGIEHILTGFDHLLFVFALILLIHDRWMLIKSVTAFTVAHSITLAGSVLGYASLAQKPVEASIALSIAFVAREIVKSGSGEQGASRLHPWLVTFAFGLLHGFGFAGALKEIGLPQSDVPLALLMFNLGVEVGQLIFIGAVSTMIYGARRLIEVPMHRARTAMGYAIGITAASWLMARLATF
jgi:hypothetical protein